MSAGKTPKVLFVYPSCFYYPEWMERVEIKSSQLLLASYISQFYPVEYADFEISIGRPNSSLQISRFERRVRDFLSSTEFDILTISCWTSLSYQATLMTARICRELYPDKLIVVGGYHPSARPEEFVTDDQLFDFVICQEGELALKQIIDQYSFRRREKTEVVKGALFTEEHFVPMKWELVDGFVDTYFPEGISIVYLYLSRGCPFSCSFCMESLKDHKWRAFSPEQSVKDLMEAARRFRVKSLSVADACFGMKSKWRKEFLKLLVEAKPEFWIALETRPEFLDEEDIKLLADLKVEVQIGVESCSPTILSIMNKSKQAERFLRQFSEVSGILSRCGVHHRANMIFNHPGETKTTMEETFAFMDRELSRQDSTLVWAANQYMHFPGCECDWNRELFENRYGSKFLSPNWWREQSDQYEGSMNIIPSSDFIGGDLDLWKLKMNEREAAMKASLSQKAFKFVAEAYFPQWKNDPRYQAK